MESVFISLHIPFTAVEGKSSNSKVFFTCGIENPAMACGATNQGLAKYSTAGQQPGSGKIFWCMAGACVTHQGGGSGKACISPASEKMRQETLTERRKNEFEELMFGFILCW